MKKLFSFFVALFFSAMAFAQSIGLIVENQTNCTQYYQVFGDEICRCGDRYSSNLIAIPPGGVHNYPSSISLGNTYPPGTPKSIVGAKIPSGPANCRVQGGTVGSPACGLPLTYTYIAFDQDCRECQRTTARWIPAPNCNSEARLVFTP